MFRHPPMLRFTLRATTLALVALALAGCTRKNGSHTGSPPASSETSAPAEKPSQIATGQALYDKYCKLCHAADGSGYAADNAPSLVSHHFLRSATDDFIAQGIRMGRPRTAMAAYGKERGGPLDDGEIAAIVAFLRSKGPSPVPLPETPLTGDIARGQALFTEQCGECHGTAVVKGNAVSLHNEEFLASARPAFLRYAIEHGRPPTRMPAFIGKLSSEQISDIVLWLRTFAPKEPTPAVADPTVPNDLPVVINPKGAHPKFTLREDLYVSAEQVKRALDAKQRMVILDARPPSDWIQFRIPGAIAFPYYDAKNAERVPKDGTWVIAYCACPHHASGEVVSALRKNGYPKTAVLDEGILVWRNLGYPLEGEAPGPALPSPSAPAAPVRK
jgi:cytochrome c oxidase cbb3-type subunit 3/ubiquinol-cytochrome c reductase cytochrome c subunit